ncbi:disease resistance-like protein DSC1 [Mercurialis annua]|uniref:disease resistance-like protein DSC1 n=1 Tax=Mercurialis annua TaxID=3986 RepID=UPI0024ADE7BA|nr:disease resistance-like protein DSC1 [Mercurialis annua]XP_055962052.1 disease resistance-like protein DSC1 [Mercurialis annua]
MADSSSASCSPKQWKYEVFLSFRSLDACNYFTSRLYSSLLDKWISVYGDEKLIRGGNEITLELSEVIEESKIAVIIFSKDFASSTFCLDEVVKIIECSETHGQTVVPVFFKVDPLDVENQTGSFESAFVEHEVDDFDKVQKWKAALFKAAKIAGWKSTLNQIDAWLVYKIVEDIMKKLSQCPDNSECLVGINSRIDEITQLLSNESKDVRILGIWGMGGIGKTTLAKAVFKKIACGFESCCFLENVKHSYERDGGHYLLKELLFQISGEKCVGIRISNFLRSPSIRRKINRKVLIVVDDVNRTQQFELFEKNRCFFGKGSRILVTSRDKQMLLSSVDDLYEVQELDSFDALTLLRQNALKRISPVEEYWHILSLYVKNAYRNPLALKILGSFLSGKNRRDWKCVLDNLKRSPIRGVQDVLKISFDDLDDDEKDIFLYIACFFRGRSCKEVTRILRCCGLNVDIGLCVLMDKSLIELKAISGKIEMHDMLQQMGKEIVLQESREPSKRSRLWDHEDIVSVLTKNNGTDAIEAIFLDMSRIEAIDLNPDVFKGMPHLKLLSFSYGSETETGDKVRLSKGLQSFPNELRYLYWHGYPLDTLPSNFHQLKILELHLPYSKLKMPPNGNMIKSLQLVDLHHSSGIIKVPELTLAANLVLLKLSGCERMRSFPSTLGLMSLECLDLSGCLGLEAFPEVSRNLKGLVLSYTAIKEVPASLGSLSKLAILNLECCMNLETLPNNMSNLKSLETLDVSGCSRLKQFPEISEIMDHFESLYLDGTAIEELPSSIDNLKALSSLRLKNCRNLVFLPESLGNLKSLEILYLQSCKKLTSLPANLTVSTSLKASGCGMLRSVPELSSLSLISKLDLSNNRFESLPGSIQQLHELLQLDISFCDRLKSLAHLPWSLQYLNAHDCRSLEHVSAPIPFFGFDDDMSSYIEEKKFEFTNCVKLDPNKSWGKVLAEVENRLQHSANVLNKSDRRYDTSRVVMYPGNEIPEWFTYTSMGNSIKIPCCKRSDDCLFCWDKAALCCVIAFPDNYRGGWLQIECNLSSYDKDTFDIRRYSNTTFAYMSNHVALCYPVTAPRREYGTGEGPWIEIKIYCGFDILEVSKCGIYPLCSCTQKCRLLPLEENDNEKQGDGHWNTNGRGTEEESEPPSKRPKQA